MARNVGMWPGSETDADVMNVDFAENLGAATITGTPTCVGTNCTATYVSHTAQGVVSYRVSAGSYAGFVVVTIVLSDGRTVARQTEHRWL